MKDVDINSMPVVCPYLDPDAPDPQLLHEAAEQASDDYVDDWCRDELYDDGHLYAEPVQALVDNEPELMIQLLSDYRKGDAAEFESSAGLLARALEKYVRGMR